MMISIDGLQAQGEALPATARHGTIHPAGGIDNHQQGWRTRHPIATTKPRTICNPSPIPGYQPGVYPFLGGHGSGAKETASPCAFLGLALSCGYPIRLGHLKPRNHPMIYTFCVTRSRGPIAALPAIRTVSVYASSEAQARTRLAGLPLVFLSRSPVRTDGGRHHG